MNQRHFVRSALILKTALVGLSVSQASETAPVGAASSSAPDRPDAQGKLVVCLASKGDYRHVPWLANDLNLVFRTARQSTFYSAHAVPVNAPVGTKILARDGLFVPMLLKAGTNSLSVEFPVDARR